MSTPAREPSPRRVPVRTPAPVAPGEVDRAMTDPHARVVLLGKPGCHLCDDARTVVSQVCAQEGVDLAERSTLDDVTWEMAYWELLPVVFVDGRRHSHWFADADRLRAALRSAPPAGAAHPPER